MKHSKAKSLFLLIISLVICYFVEYTASIFTQKSVSSWYLGLNKPEWNPPNIVFPIVWTTLYTLMGLTLWLILKHKKIDSLKLFVSQLILNFLWSYLFFYLQSPVLGALCISLLFAFLIANTVSLAKWSKFGTFSFVLYSLWIAYATALNWTIVILNN